MLKTRSKHVSGLVAACIGVFATGLLATATAATHSSIQDRRITMSEAKRMVAVADSDEFPLVVNELVLEQLNRFIGTPDGREFMRQSLERMKIYESGIVEDLNRYLLPHELLAVPLIESGYRNLPHDGNPAHGVGLWMFIKHTARNFGLRVDEQVDERLDVSLSTDAAMRLLGSLNLQFKDWGLALLAYNSGAAAVNRGINETGSRDAWELVRSGHENDRRYLASVMATVLIMKNPSYLD